jgi:flagellar L-ring protein precursor FlgH
MKNPILYISLALNLAVNIAISAPTYSLYTDKKGKRIGDVITVMIVENAQANTDSRTQTQKRNQVNASLNDGKGLLSFIPGLGARANHDINYDGNGQTARNGELTAKVSVQIDEVFDNGNLLIKGSKNVFVNEEKQILDVEGIVRPEDINSDNTIFSYKIADAKIRYSGDGDVQDAARPGIIARFFNWIF